MVQLFARLQKILSLIFRLGLRLRAIFYLAPHGTTKSLHPKRPGRHQDIHSRNVCGRVDVHSRYSALVIGINYPGMKEAMGGIGGELFGCHNDAESIQKLLTGTYKWQTNEVTMMLDKPENKNSPCFPSRANIIVALKNLTKDVRPGDVFVVYYAGHSIQTEETGKDQGGEVDKKDENIVGADLHNILDNDLRDMLVKPLLQVLETRLVAIFDTCHSETLLDLKNSDTNNLDTGSKLPVIISLSACHDNGYAQEKKGRGVMTVALCKILEGNPSIVLQDFVRGISTSVKESVKGDDFQRHPDTRGLVHRHLSLETPLFVLSSEYRLRMSAECLLPSRSQQHDSDPKPPISNPDVAPAKKTKKRANLFPFTPFCPGRFSWWHR